MITKINSWPLFLLLVISSFLSGEIEYEIHDIGTLQMQSSRAITLNNQGQILGWYSVDGSENGMHFFVRDRDGKFHEVPSKGDAAGPDIDWRYLTNDGKVYGIISSSHTFDSYTYGTIWYSLDELYVWDEKNGVVRLETPRGSIVAINDLGDVLMGILKDDSELLTFHSVIWNNGKITKLHGLVGSEGIPSTRLSVYGMNNKGEVVGSSQVSHCYKNRIYTQNHAVKWVEGIPIDLQSKFPVKTQNCTAIAINDNSDVLLHNGDAWDGETSYYALKCCEAKVFPVSLPLSSWSSGRSTVFQEIQIQNEFLKFFNIYSPDQNTHDLYVTMLGNLNDKIAQDFNSIWSRLLKLVSMNDNGEIIANGRTIYDEEHIMFLSPKTPNNAVSTSE